MKCSNTSIAEYHIGEAIAHAYAVRNWAALRYLLRLVKDLTK